MSSTQPQHTRKFLKDAYESVKTLNFKQQVYISFLISTPISHILVHMNRIQKYGATIFIPVHVLIVCCVTIPLYIMYNTLGTLTRRSFIRIWDMCPILQGACICMYVNICYNVAMNMSYMPLNLIYLVNTMKPELDSVTCFFPGVSLQCVRKENGQNFTKECCPSRKNCKLEILFSYIDWARTFSYGDPESTNFNPSMYKMRYDWIIACLFTMAVVNIFVMADIHFYKHILSILANYYGFLAICFIVITMVYSLRVLCPVNYQTDAEMIKSPGFYLDILTHALYFERPAEQIFVTSMADIQTEPVGIACSIFAIKLVILNAFAAWLAIGHSFISKAYLVNDPYCIHANGKDIVFGVIPDLLTEQVFPQLFLMFYYLSLALYTLQYAVILITCLVNTLIDAYPKFAKKRLLLTVFFTGVCISVMLGFQVRIFNIYFQGWRQSAYWLLAMLNYFSGFTGVALYGFQKLSNDYHFLFGRHPKYYSHYGFKLCAYLFYVHFILFLIYFKDLKISKVQVGAKMPIIYFMTAMTICPFFIVAFYNIVISVVKKKNRVWCQKDFGPPDCEILEARKNFAPQTRAKFFYSEITCQHDCLLYSAKLAEFKDALEEKKKLMGLLFLKDVHSHSSIIKIQWTTSYTQFNELRNEFEQQKINTLRDVQFLRKLELEHIAEEQLNN